MRIRNWNIITGTFTLIGGVVAIIQLRKWLLVPVILVREFDIEMPIASVWDVVGNPAKWRNWMFGRWFYGELPSSPQPGSEVDYYSAGENRYVFSSTVSKYVPHEVIQIDSDEFRIKQINGRMTNVRYIQTFEDLGIIDSIAYLLTNKFINESHTLIDSRIDALEEYLEEQPFNDDVSAQRNYKDKLRS